jgi:hypothetical protein
MIEFDSMLNLLETQRRPMEGKLYTSIASILRSVMYPQLSMNEDLL